MSIERLAQQLRTARRIVVLTGAGVSAESGLRTFRGNEKDMASLWKAFDPMRLATPEAFAADPELVTRWYDWRRLGCLAAEPNPAHLALAELERRLEEKGRASAAPGGLTILTQNVDRLHHRAGSRTVVELHGTIMVWRCTRTGKELEPGPDALAEFPWRSPFDPRGLMRPAFVWFGEALPDAALAAADEALRTCDLFISVGTSSVVYPAAAFVDIAWSRDVPTAEINAEQTPISHRVTWSIRGKAGEVLPAVVSKAFG